jgi:16S rRNA (cytosine967-C5)-methyltransferase
VLGELEREGIGLAPGGLLTSARIVANGDVTQTRPFRAGRVFIQDEASQLVAALVGKGLRILDCCAAPGGKTAAIASRNPQSEIVAAELHLHRAELLRQRVQAANVRVINADALQLSADGGFDRVLADVPCSGTGTLARNPEIKWRLKPADLIELHEKQLAILRAALRQLTPGGRAIYSSCSLESEENEAVVNEGLQSESGYRLLDCRSELERLKHSGELAIQDVDGLLTGPYMRTIPGKQHCDGFFAAILERSS